MQRIEYAERLVRGGFPEAVARAPGRPRERFLRASTVGIQDFRGLRHLADRLGDDFLVGIVLYMGEQTLSFGPRLRVMPISALWQPLRSEP